MNMKTKSIFASVTTFIMLTVCCLTCSFADQNAQAKVLPPSLNNNPQFDMVLTNRKPILSANNPTYDPATFTLEFELSTNPTFPADKTISYSDIKCESRGISELQVKDGDELDDGTYYWRARTVMQDGTKSEWVQTRFYVDVKNSRTFSGFLRASVKDIFVSSGEDAKNIIDWNDQGQITFWNSAPPAGEPFSWVMLDMGKPTPVTRFWMLSTRETSMAAGWLTHFVWQYSNDKEKWTNLPETEIKDNDTYRNIIDFTPVNARYYRLAIFSQNALQAQINVIVPYVKGQPTVPEVPEGKYVLIIGNQMNGYTYTDLVGFVKKQEYEAIIIPHYEMSYDVLQKLKNKPMAIICSGNNADWQNLPIFEYYGEYEIIREVDDIPMMGICAGNEFMAMAYGVSFAHWMGWFDDTMFRVYKGEKPEPVNIKKEFLNDPIFKDVPNPFRAVEIHSWAISPLFLKDKRYSEFRETASTTYIQTLKSMKRPVYSEQFHGAAVNSYNQSGKYLSNFLKIADKR
ncbi:MAG: discoidin domain-containing protein [Kiritimatiellae bacterium]|jgi:anthranilate/para-aminobenzoate synthase component II|nr:discoidin domain-containing protein [Kiritimatiellia bacterium]